ncbi:MAG: hypothetical protein AAB637_00270 [Patescibacteria group bacterium]
MKTMFFVIVTVASMLLASGCVSAQTPRTHRFTGGPAIALGASKLPPTVPYSYRFSSNLDGSKQSWSEKGSYQYVTPMSVYHGDGTISYTNIVTTYSYTNSYRYNGPGRYYYPGTVDGKSTAKPGTIVWPAPKKRK